MSRTSHNREYAQLLGQIYGDEFQEEIIFLLTRTYLDFQRIAQKPHGDGGFDGLSHGLTHGYFCYGLDLQPTSKTTPDELRTKVARKFREDFRKIFELKYEGKALVHEENSRLATVLTAGKKVKHLRLIANYAEDHRLIGDLNQSWTEYKQASACRFIDDTCGWHLWGPDDICGNLIIDEIALFRIKEPNIANIISEIENTEPHQLPPPTITTDNLEDKIMALNNDKEFIEEQKEYILTDWRRHLFMMQKFNTHIPDYHKRLEVLVKKSAAEANFASVAGPKAAPTELVRNVREKIYFGAKAILCPAMPDSVAQEFADWTVARMIGHCPLDWRKSKQS